MKYLIKIYYLRVTKTKPFCNEPHAGVLLSGKITVALPRQVGNDLVKFHHAIKFLAREGANLGTKILFS